MDIDHNTLEARAKALRIKTLDFALEHDLAHLGGCFSAIEILVSLYDKVLGPEDRFVLSKGHSCIPYYLLLREKGFNPEVLGHPEIDPENGIYCTTGSLGHGLPITTGMALARKIKDQPGQFYVLMSDGECEEGTTWESLDLASKYNLDNLTLIIDYNKIQALDFIKDVRPNLNLRQKFESFGCDVKEINGHSYQELIPSLLHRSNKPYVVLAHTTKGKGVSYMENDPVWHGRKPKPERLKQAYEELK